MARRWHNESWRKLYTRMEGQWLRLPALARGLASDLLKYADEEGVLLTLRSGEMPGKAVASMVGAHAWEARTVVRCADELLLDGYLLVVGDVVSIRNFVEAQTRRSPAAVKQQRYRDKAERDSNDTGNGDGNTSGNVLPTSLPSVTGRRDETRRDEINKDLLEPVGREPSPRFDFPALYARYPRKQGKRDGLARLTKTCRTDADYQRHATAIGHIVAHVERGDLAVEFVPHFSTWVNGRWEDYADGIPLPPPTAKVSAFARPEPVRNPDTLTDLAAAARRLTGGAP